MRINIRDLREGAVSVLPFDFTEDISETEPTAAEPIRIFGEIQNRADVLLLSMTVEGMRNLVCDRCAKEFTRKTSVPFEGCIVDHLDNEDDEDAFILCEGDELSLSELAMSVFILGFESKTLCSEDCKGICPICGMDLNEQACNCKAESHDPRLEILAQLLDDE